VANRPTVIPGSASEAPTRADELVSRIAPDFAGAGDVDPNHHLWRNGRLWWIAFTVHRGPYQERVRFSLKTADAVEARRRRDRVFALYGAAADCNISIRLKRRGPARGRRSSRRDAPTREPGRARVRRRASRAEGSR